MFANNHLILFERAIPCLFCFIFVFSIQLTVKCSILADDWIQTADLWKWKRPPYQLSHNHSPNQLILCLSFTIVLESSVRPSPFQIQNSCLHFAEPQSMKLVYGRCSDDLRLLKWTIPASFSLFLSFLETVNSSNVHWKLPTYVMIRTRVMWCWKHPGCQLFHNHCPTALKTTARF